VVLGIGFRHGMSNGLPLGSARSGDREIFSHPLCDSARRYNASIADVASPVPKNHEISLRLSAGLNEVAPGHTALSRLCDKEKPNLVNDEKLAAETEWIKEDRLWHDACGEINVAKREIAKGGLSLRVLAWVFPEVK